MADELSAHGAAKKIRGPSREDMPAYCEFSLRPRLLQPSRRHLSVSDTE